MAHDAREAVRHAEERVANRAEDVAHKAQEMGDKFVERVTGGADAAMHAQDNTTGFSPNPDAVNAALRGAARSSTVGPGAPDRGMDRGGVTDVPDPTKGPGGVGGNGASGGVSGGGTRPGEVPPLGGARGPAGKGPQATIQEHVRDVGRSQ